MNARTLRNLLVCAVIFVLQTSSALSETHHHDKVEKSPTKSVYVPVYSHIYFGDALRPFNLATTVSIRNVGRSGSIVITAAEYRNSEGKLLRNLVENPVSISPFSSHTLKVKESDVSGGSGASVIITWHSIDNAAPPLIESVMIGTANGQGISFTSRSVPVEERS